MSAEKAQIIATLTAGMLAARTQPGETTETVWRQAEAIVSDYLDREREKISAIVTPKVEMSRHEQDVARSIANLLELESGGTEQPVR